MANLVLFDASHQAMNGYLHELVFVRANSPVVSCFLVSVSCMLRSTIASLPAIQRSKLPPFTNLGEFINQYGSGGHSIPVVETTLLCIAQLADFMW